MNILRFWQLPVFAPDDVGGAAAPAGGDSAPAPSGGETPVTGETSVPGDSSSGDEFSGLGGFDDDINTVTVKEIPAAAPAAAKAPVSAQTPSAPPAPAAPAAQTAPAAPAPTPPAPAPAAPTGQPEAAPQAQAPASPPSDPVSLLKELETHRDGVIAALASDSRFGLSQDEATLLETDPGKAVPQLLARTYYQAVNAALTHINNFVPQMVARHIEGTRVQNERENAFYQQFPALDRTKHAGDVATFAKLFRQQSPQMAMSELFQMVGAAVMAKNGLSAAVAAPHPAANGRPPQPAITAPPFAPARAGAEVRTTPVEENPFAGLGQDWDA